MANFQIKIKNKYSVTTYEDTKKTYDWICNAINTVKIINAKKQESFLFDIGKVTCTCDNIEEFIENAYGQAEYNLIQMKVFQIDPINNQNLFVFADKQGIVISSNNKKNLEIIIGELDKVEESKGATYIENHYNISDISGNNNNLIQGNDNAVHISIPEEKKPSKLKQWFEAILQNLLANWLWIVLPTILAFLIGLLI